MRARTRIKFCGVTDPETALAAAGLGADAVGLVFYEPSPRHLEPERAAVVAGALPPFVSRVGLFLDPEPDWVRRVMAIVDLDYLQFHGSEPAEFCRRFGRRYLKSVPMGDHPELGTYSGLYPDAAALLLDSNRAGQAGGTGETFDWTAALRGIDRPLVLAGGLTPDNVAGAIAAVRPFAVDVSSGVESRRGVKDRLLMGRFAAEVKRADERIAHD